MSTMTDTATCRYCGRSIVNEAGRWIDPAATGDDSVWRETCEDHDTFTAEHEPTQNIWAMNIWAMLEQEAPLGCAGVQDLYSWSLNFDAGCTPFGLFIDLIGWSEENYGMTFLTAGLPTLGYLEVGKLAAALTEYAEHPNEVTEYVSALMAAESSD